MNWKMILRSGKEFLIVNWDSKEIESLLNSETAKTLYCYEFSYKKYYKICVCLNPNNIEYIQKSSLEGLTL